MKSGLEHLSKQELIGLLDKQNEQAVLEKKVLYLEEKNIQLEQKIAYLNAQVQMLQRMQFGQKRERFEADSAQLPLPFQVPAQQEEEQQQVVEEQISYVRKKQSAHKGRTALPAHLPVEEVEIYPEGDLSQMLLPFGR